MRNCYCRKAREGRISTYEKRLHIDGKKLEDNVTLAEYKIVQEQTLNMAMFEEIDGPPAKEQRLTYRGKQLEDHHTIAESNIENEADLRLFLRLNMVCKQCLRTGCAPI
ncbi:hypothetical protein IFM89_007564 [Coptis chinensis]|uniref:Ubiquitin-like domain-containing protein n=1 Tax=Coptis chinensis TaxID=261450 RepID=A0A835I1B7_9MAGN|nr:hypothetical protein IFM89_007564 [Coptis chinensis]